MLGFDKSWLAAHDIDAYFWRRLRVAGHPDATLYKFDGYDNEMVEPAHPVTLKFMQRILAER